MSIACLAICIHTTRTLYNTRLTIINYPDGLTPTGKLHVKNDPALWQITMTRLIKHYLIQYHPLVQCFNDKLM